MALRVYHAGGWGKNWGDRIIQASFRQHMEKVASAWARCELEWRYIDYQNEPFNDSLIHEINQRASVLVIGPGGAIMNREHGPFQAQINPGRWGEITCPIAVHAIGWNEFPYRDTIRKNHPQIVEMVGRADSFTVRNTGTRRAAGWSDRVQVVPDAGLFIEPRHARMDVGDFNIGVCWASDRPEKRWPDITTENRFRANLWAAIYEIQQQHKARVWEFEHIDENASLDGAAGIAGRYANMDLVLGMRKHSVIVPYGLGVPTIGLGDQAEVRWFLEDMGESDYLITTDNMDDLSSTIGRLLKDRHWRNRVTRKREKLQLEFWAALYRILRMAGVNGR